MIDPSKDKFAYFKDNIQTAEDKEDFDASQYYYHRDDFGSKALGASASASGNGGGGGGALGGSGLHGMGFQSVGGGMDMHADALGGGLSGFGGVLGGAGGAFMGVAGMPMSHELHRMGSADHLAAVVKGRQFPPQMENKAPDMSEFPALGSRMGALSIDSGFDGGAPAAARQVPPAEFTIQKEDFPALSTLSAGASDKGATPRAAELKRHSSFTMSATDNAVLAPAPPRGGATAIGVRAGSALAAESVGAGGSGSGVSLSGGAFGHLRAEEAPSSGAAGMDASNQFGLLGMLHTIIRPGNEAKKNLAMGIDLTTLGLNLNAAEPLHPTFASPWADDPLAREPQYSLPACYYNQPPVLKTTHLSKLHLETLFYVFYAMPKDVLQAYAAQELYARDWRFHAELKIWLKRASAADAALLAGGTGGSSGLAALGTSSALSPAGSALASSGTSAGSIGSIGSSGPSATAAAAAAATPQFIYFDAAAWERRAFSGSVAALAAGLLPDDEVRVKV